MFKTVAAGVGFEELTKREQLATSAVEFPPDTVLGI